MSYTDLVLAVPAWARLLLTVLVTVGITVGIVIVLHGRILAFNAESEGEDDDAADDDEEAPPAAPPMYFLSGRVISLTTTAFIFLLAFTLGNLWANQRAAEQATQAEAADLNRVAAAAQFLPPEHRDPIVAAVDAYGTSVREVAWRYMEAGDAFGALRTHTAASEDLVEAAAAAAASGAANSGAWSPLSTAIDEVLTNATLRISHVPGQRTSAVLLLVCGLGLVNLAMIAAFQPAPLRSNVFLIGVVAAITATLVFVVVETSNPYLGSGALKPTMYSVEFQEASSSTGSASALAAARSPK